MASDLSKLTLFVENFRTFEETTRLKFIDDEKRRLAQFIDTFRVAENKEARDVRLLAPHFNLFSILRIGHLEDGVHSPFVANLINPHGSHGQGRLFFDLLIDRICGDGFATRVNDIEIREEYGRDGSIMDMFVRCKVDSQPFFMVIENKIYSGDQSKQMTRYYEILKKSFHVDENYLMIYLTPDGRSPHPDSICRELLNALMTERKFFCMSYVVDVLDILEKSLLTIEASRVREIILQYILTIKTL